MLWSDVQLYPDTNPTDDDYFVSDLLWADPATPETEADAGFWKSKHFPAGFVSLSVLSLLCCS